MRAPLKTAAATWAPSLNIIIIIIILLWSPYTQNKSAKNICIEEKVIIWINFNPGLALIGFRTILPCFNKLTWYEPAI